MKFNYLLVLVILCYLPCASATDSTPTQKSYKSNYNNEKGFAAPGSTVRQLEEDDEEKTSVLRWQFFDDALQPWFDKKKEVNDNIGLQYSIAYTATVQKASDSLTDEDVGASSVLRFSGKWELYNRGNKDKGSLVFSIDHRAPFDDAAAADLSGQIGYIGPTATIFGDTDTVLVDFNWQQFFNNGNTGLVVGSLRP